MAAKIFFSVFLMAINYSCFSQDEQPFPILSLVSGLGNYEYLHLGINLRIKKKNYFETALGIKPWGFNNNNYQVFYLSFGRQLLKEKPRKITPFIQIKEMIWHFNNTYNQFVVLGTNAELRLLYSINKRFRLCLNGGVIYNDPIY